MAGQPFLTYRETDNDGVLQYYILQKEWPHYSGMVVTDPYFKTILKIPIAGYNMYVSFNGVLRGRCIPILKGEDKEMLVVLQNMGSWFFDNRILPNPSKYKKFKVNAQIPG